MKALETDLDAKLLAARIVAIAMIASLGVYAVVVEVLAAQALGGEPPLPAESHDTVRTILYGVAIADGFLATLLARLLRPGADAADPVSRLFAASVVALALAEAPGIFGLVLFILTRNASEAYPLIGLSAVLLLFHFPRRDRWLEAVGGRHSTL